MKMYRSLLLYLLVCLLLAAAKAETWYFLPNYHHNIQGIETPFEGNGWFHESVPTVLEPLWSPGGGLDDAQRHELYWHRVTFPHRGFVELMPQERVFGWYACEFDIPAELDGLDVLADLGIIDDTDETFVNGNRVGGVGTLGQSHGTAWQEDLL